MEDRIGPKPKQSTLLLTRSDVAGLLDLRECIAAVEGAFRLHATGKATAFAVAMSAELSIPVTQVAGLAESIAASDIVITCTTASEFFIAREMVKPGTFIAAGLMARSDVHAQLGEIVAGSKRGRAREDEIIVFDSSGTALQDVAAAAAVYRRALAQQQGSRFSFDA